MFLPVTITMRYYLLPLLLCSCLCTGARAQTTAVSSDTLPPDLYKTKPLVELPLTAVGFFLSQERIVAFRNKAPFEGDLPTLEDNDVPAIDRWGLRQDPEKAEDFARVSDVIFGSAQLAPLALFAFKKYRREWLDILTMYLEAQATQGMFYGYAPFGPGGIDRFRPRSFYGETDVFTDEQRRNGNAQSSMFSGHVSTTSTGYWFLAKMIVDHNPQFSGGKKALVYGVASLPSITVAILRVKALKHFMTDTFVGLGVGAFSGIMMPEFHRWWRKKHPKSMAVINPVYGGGVAGMGMTLVF